jgi:hypothetical protein
LRTIRVFSEIVKWNQELYREVVLLKIKIFNSNTLVSNKSMQLDSRVKIIKRLPLFYAKIELTSWKDPII